MEFSRTLPEEVPRSRLLYRQPGRRHTQAGGIRHAGAGTVPLARHQLGDLRTRLDLLEDPGHLFFREARVLHAEPLGWELYFQLDLINEDASRRRQIRRKTRSRVRKNLSKRISNL